MNKSDRLKACMELDRQITPLYATIAELNTRRNTFASIARLPTETLSKIFESIISLDQTEFSSGGLQWIHLMEVCRHWRSVMIESPRLWSSLAFHSVEVTSEMLRRSKASPLVIKVDLASAESMLGAVELALSHISRVRVLHINVSRNDSEGLLAAIARPAPLLTSLFLSNFGNQNAHTIPPSLFAPRLRYLVIHNLNIAWGSPFLVGLTHLEIHESATPPSLDEFRIVLSRCPALEALILGGNSTRPMTRPNRSPLVIGSCDSQDPIPLPTLAELHLHGPVPDCDIIIHNLSFPPTTTVELYTVLGRNIPAELPRLVAGLGGRGNGFSFDRLFIFTNCLSSINFRAWPSTNNTLVDPLLNLSFYKGALSDEYSSAFLVRTVCKGLSPTEILSVNINFDMHVGRRHSWETILGSLKNLQVLEVAEANPGGLISALTPTPIAGAEKSRRWKVFLRHLHTLVLQQVYFEDVSEALALQVCLMLRWENHAEIKTLRLVDCDSLRCDIDRLKEIVVDVDCVTIEMEDSSSDSGSYSE
jgi:hypothetical protein